MFSYLYLLQTTLYTFSYLHMSSTAVYEPLCVPLHTSQWNRWRYCVCVSACVNIYLSICLSVYLSICLLDWSFTFTEKSDCDKAKQVLSMISITSILVELTQIIGCYVSSSVVGLSVFLSVSSKDMRFTSKWYYVYISHFRRGTWCSSHYGELVKKLKF